MGNSLQRLQNWYENNCDGDWEHGYGVSIGTLDNPGWRIKVDLTDTCLEDIPFEAIKYQNTDEDDWAHCWKQGFEFHCAGGPQNLEEMLGIFLDWAEVNAD